MLVGSGSSLFAAQLGALALRRRAIHADAVAATEARSDNAAYRERTLIAVSQSGRSRDVLDAINALAPRKLIVLTNTPRSPLAERADVTIDIGAGDERAIPATKSVTATVAVLLTAATIVAGEHSRTPGALVEAARIVREWLHEENLHGAAIASAIAQCRDVMILGTDYGVPVAREAALKFKEATYMHAEGFEAGEFRHGSAAMVDASSVVIGIVDRDGEEIVAKPLREAEKTNALRIVVGTEPVDDLERFGPVVADPYNTLGWLVAVQLLALHVARARAIDSDTPRGLTKAITE